MDELLVYLNGLLIKVYLYILVIAGFASISLETFKIGSGTANAKKI